MSLIDEARVIIYDHMFTIQATGVHGVGFLKKCVTFPGVPALRTRLRLHDPGQRVPDAPAGHQDEGGQPQPDPEEQGGRSERSHRQNNHARLDHTTSCGLCLSAYDLFL